ncbi:MAG: tRNA (adenosine(37)-N6)-threonylcarbamoyltransferase complex ATPase subunit type 1 TsaE [Rickettsiales bacterium]
MLLIEREFNLNQINEIIELLFLYINSNSILLLNGEIGSGKTTFIKYLLEKFGISKNEVESPTYNILIQYKAKLNQIPVIINHYDLYRIDKGDINSIDLYENLSNSISIIEWSENKLDITYFKKNIINIYLIYVDDITRRIKIFAS